MIIQLCPPIYTYFPIHFKKIDRTTKNSGDIIRFSPLSIIQVVDDAMHQENLNRSKQNLDLPSWNSQLFIIKSRPFSVKINLNFLLKWCSIHLENEESFLDEIKAFFRIFEMLPFGKIWKRRGQKLEGVT